MSSAVTTESTRDSPGRSGGLVSAAFGIACSCAAVVLLYWTARAAWQAQFDPTWAGDRAYVEAWDLWMLAWPFSLLALVLLSSMSADRGHHWVVRIAGAALLVAGGWFLWLAFPDSLLVGLPLGAIFILAGSSLLGRWKAWPSFQSVTVIFLVLTLVSAVFVDRWSDYSVTRRELLRRDWIALEPAAARIHFARDGRFLAKALPAAIACRGKNVTGSRNVSGRWQFDPGNGPNRRIELSPDEVRGGPCAVRASIELVRKPWKVIEARTRSPDGTLRFVAEDAPAEMRQAGVAYADFR